MRRTSAVPTPETPKCSSMVCPRRSSIYFSSVGTSVTTQNPYSSLVSAGLTQILTSLCDPSATIANFALYIPELVSTSTYPGISLQRKNIFLHMDFNFCFLCIFKQEIIKQKSGDENRQTIIFMCLDQLVFEKILAPIISHSIISGGISKSR
jgi:hypothetical protein